MTEWFAWREAPLGEYAVIGDPVSHSRSPAMHAAAYRAFGLDWRYRAIQVHLHEFEPALDHLAALGYRGLNVTVPLKSAAYSWSLRRDANAEACGAVNTLMLADRSGANTDLPGLLACLDRFDLEAGSPALVLGAGDSARTCWIALSGRHRVKAWNRTRDRLATFEGTAGIEILDQPDPAGCSLILDATSAALAGQSPPVLWDRAEPGATACCLAYGAQTPPFLRDAAARGLKTEDGHRLLVEQGHLSLSLWLGRDAGPAAFQAMLKAVA